MRRAGRRHGSDYLEENEELNDALQESYDDYDVDADDVEAAYEEDDVDEKSSSGVWKKIGKIALVIIVLIALFFVSMKITEICLDRNQEPDSYSNDAPAYNESEDEDIPVVNEEPEEEVMEEYKEKDLTTPVPSKPEETEKPEETPTPAEPEKPAETEKPAEPEKPSTPETPSTPSKPIITPGNPAA